MANLVERQDALYSRYSEMKRAAEMCGYVATASIIAVGAELAFNRACTMDTARASLVFIAASIIALILARYFDRKASSFRSQVMRLVYVLRNIRSHS